MPGVSKRAKDARRKQEGEAREMMPGVSKRAKDIHRFVSVSNTLNVSIVRVFIGHLAMHVLWCIPLLLFQILQW